MSQRTTIGAVQARLNGDYNGVTDLQQHIDTATLIIDRVKQCSIDRNMALTDPELEMLERLLAAHSYVQTDQTYANKSTEGASASFHGKTAMHLESSRYGQMAMDLDWSGCLTIISKRAFAQVIWLGKAPSDQIPYDQRN